MKKILLFIFMIIIVPECMYCQVLTNNLNPVYRHYNIPLYKEEVILDSLIKSVIVKDSGCKKYFILKIFKDSDKMSFLLFQVEQKELGLTIDFKRDFEDGFWGYFETKQCTVLVSGTGSLIQLLKKTNKLRRFDFIYDEYNNEDPVKRREYLFGASYAFKNGKFVYDLLINH
jgi:hypothetical protein